MLPPQKVSEATAVFNKNRTWPSAQNYVRNRWDQFQVFAGLLGNAAEDEYTRLSNFVNDPCTAIQIYLSSYFIEKGLHFSPNNCDIIPKLLFFYINFLLVNCILPDKEDNLRSALSIIETAKTELLLFPTIGKTHPDHFNLTCREIFGEPITVLTSETDVISASIQDGDADDVENSTAAGSEPSRKEGKSNRAEDIDSQVEHASTHNPSVFTECNVSSGSGWGELQTSSLEDSPSGWVIHPGTAASSSGWGNGQTSLSGWGTAAVDPVAQTEDRGWWDISLPPPASSHIPACITNSLPNTYVRGVVEHSVRRIKTIMPIDQNLPKVKSENDLLNPTELERELLRSYWTVILEPWPTTISGTPITSNIPCILSSCKGSVDSQVIDKISVEEGSLIDRHVGNVKPHNCLMDEITIFLEDESKQCLKVGMGLGGTWVQLLRASDCVKGVWKTETDLEMRYWYAEDILRIWPSYYLV
ncbi:hypothetical protein GYMLUDRAFT_633143 [Collybiopsis luxurians FD-317 M1]|nr:hypothetical protein GYMLUDRAFT_633143 [Collybiopsis luxurians FD-317 M1]